MLNYLGPNFGSAPVTAGLPPADPGTIPSAIPGAPQGGSVSPTGAIIPSRPMSISPSLTGAISPSTMGAPPPPDSSDPSSAEYENITQQDGSIVLFLKNADGTRGPAVKIIPPIKSAAPSK